MPKNQEVKGKTKLLSKYLIYGLQDPISNEIRYVGKSCKWLLRPREHFYLSQLKNKSYKNSWIKHLIAKGLKPKIKVIEEVKNEQILNKREIYWIAYYKKIVKKFTNTTPGGTGGNTGGAW